MSGKAAAGGLQELCFKYTEWLQVRGGFCVARRLEANIGT